MNIYDRMKNGADIDMVNDKEYMNEAFKEMQRSRKLCYKANNLEPYSNEIRNVLDSKNVYYQTAELGKVDQGGGGTIAYILGNYNMNVIDAGVAVLNMHAPMEIVSKVDVYEAYVAYLTFLENI